MGVFAVTQLGAVVARRGSELRTIFRDTREPFGNRAVIGRRVTKSLGRQRPSEATRRLAVVGIEFGEKCRIIAGVDDDADALMVLGGRAQHRRTADVDVLDDFVETRTTRERFAEGVEIADEKVDWRDVMRQQRRLMLGIAAHRQKAAMHLRVEGFHATVHHLRKARDFGDVEHGNAGLFERRT